MKNDSSISLRVKSSIEKNDQYTPDDLCNIFESKVILLVWWSMKLLLLKLPKTSEA